MRLITLNPALNSLFQIQVKMNLKLNAFSWNPMEPYVFTAACEDYNLYTYDCRFFKHPKRVYQGHTNAVMDVDYSPSGREFASASYDDTVSTRGVFFIVAV